MSKKRDQEIKRLIKYAAGMGCKVYLHDKHNDDTDGEFRLDGSRIDLYTSKLSKIYTVLILIHEIAHLVGFIHKFDRKIDEKFYQASANIELSEALFGESHKKDRKAIMDAEVHDTRYWDTIVKDCKIELNPLRIEEERQMDIWSYTYFYETGKFPNRDAQRAKRREIKKSLR